jgi:zinc protease
MIKKLLLIFVASMIALSAQAAGLFSKLGDSRAMSNDSLIEVIKQSNESLRREVLDNGMILLVKEDASAPVVSVQIWIGTGAIHEGDRLGAGLSHYVEHMIFKGTPTRKVGDITREINDAGGRINAYTTTDRVVIYTDMPSAHWKTGVDVLTDAVMNSTFPEEEWEREKEVINNEIVMGRDDPARVMQKLAARTAYRVHPYRVPVIGYEEVLKGMTREDLMSFFKEHYVPNNMITVVVGDVDADEVVARLKHIYKDWQRQSHENPVLPEEPPQVSRRFARETGHYNISRARVGYHTVALHDEDMPALDVLSAVVGHGRSSRLNKELKERRRLVHSISAWSYTPKYPGQFAVSAVFDPDKENEVLAAIDEQVQSFHDIEISDEELEKARRQVLSNELSDLQTMKGQASNYASSEFYVGNPRFNEVYIQSILAVTPEDVRAVARKYLRRENSSVAILSPERPADTSEVKPAVMAASAVKKIDLDDNLRLLVREDHKLPFVYISVVCGGGLLSETAENNGITQLMADMLMRGTPSRSYDEITGTAEEHGGALQPFSGRNSFGLQARCLTPDASLFMDLVSDCMLNASFPTNELLRQVDTQLTRIKQEKEDPLSVARENLRAAMFPDHPYRFSVDGTEGSVSALTAKDLKDHHRKLVVSGNTVVSVFGDITADDARKLVEKAFRKLPADVAPALSREAAPPKTPQDITARMPKQQTIFLMAYPGVSILDKKNFDGLDLLQTTMSGLSSKLGEEVREKRGLVYYSGAFQLSGVDPGMYIMYAGTREKDLPELSRLFKEEVKRVTTEGISQAELDQARNRLIAGHQMSLQDNFELAMSCGLNELTGLGYNYGFTMEERLKSFTLDDIKRIAAAYLKEENVISSTVMPAE